jgi:hypothetical protein
MFDRDRGGGRRLRWPAVGSLVATAAGAAVAVGGTAVAVAASIGVAVAAVARAAPRPAGGAAPSPRRGQHRAHDRDPQPVGTAGRRCASAAPPPVAAPLRPGARSDWTRRSNSSCGSPAFHLGEIGGCTSAKLERNRDGVEQHRTRQLRSSAADASLFTQRDPTECCVQTTITERDGRERALDRIVELGADRMSLWSIHTEMPRASSACTSAWTRVRSSRA